MKFKFSKMHGCGNDYVYVDGKSEKISQEKKSELAIKVSDRNFGIGSDGLIFINPVDDENIDFEMEMYNADGSRSEMCGNGIRCVAKYVYDKGLTTKKNLVIVSAGKKKYIDLTIGDDGMVSSVKVDMGAPILKPDEVPVIYSGDRIVNAPIVVDGKTWHMTCVSMGNPHAVVFLPEDMNLEEFDIEKIGPKFENHEFFPRRVNTEFVKIDDKNNVHMRVWERGTGETLACGTGACAVVTAAAANGISPVNEDISVHLKGGVLTIRYTGENVLMTGAAEFSFDGEIEV